MSDASDAPIVSSKSDFLSSATPERELVYIDAAKKRVWVSGYTADQDDRLAIIRRDETQNRNLLAIIASLVIVNEHGERIYSDSDKDQLSKMSVKALSQIAGVARRLSAQTPESRADLGKGSAATGDAASSSS